MSSPQITWDEPKPAARSLEVKWDEQPAKKPGFFDRDPGYLDRDEPITDHWKATESGLKTIGRGLRSAVIGGWKGTSAQPEGAVEKIANIAAPGIGVPAVRAVKGLAPLLDAPKIPAAVHDINQSDEPTGAYLNAAQETAGQGAGQALTAIASHGVGEATPVIGEAVRSPTAGKLAKTAGVLSKTPLKVASKLPVVKDVVEGANAGLETLREIKPIWQKPPVYPGAPYPEAPGIFPGAPLPAVPQPEQINPSLVSPARSIPGQVPPELTPGGFQLIGRAIARQEPIPARKGLALPAASAAEATPDFWAKTSSVGKGEGDLFANAKQELFPGKRELSTAETTQVETRAREMAAKPVANAVPKPAKVEEILNESLGGKIPPGHTPVKSTAIRSYKYDPATREFEASTTGGTYIHGDVSPEQAQAFEQASSKGKAWAELKKNSTYVGKIVNGKRVAAIPPMNLRSGVPDIAEPIPAETAPAIRVEKKPPKATTEESLMDQLKESLKRANAKRK